MERLHHLDLKVPNLDGKVSIGILTEWLREIFDGPIDEVAIGRLQDLCDPSSTTMTHENINATYFKWVGASARKVTSTYLALTYYSALQYTLLEGKSNPSG